MSRLKRILASTLSALFIIAGLTVVAPMANASAAEAYTATQCHYEWYGGYRRDTVCYYDYNWFEESPWGGSHRDGWYRTGITYA